MTEKILNLLKDFLKNNNIEDLDLGEIAKSLPIEEINAMISGKDEYVIKRSGHLEKFNEEKISRSIKNAADRAGMQINSSDIELILKDVAEKLFYGDNKRLTRTTQVKDLILEALKSDGFSKVRDAYQTYAQDQN